MPAPEEIEPVNDNSEYKKSVLAIIDRIDQAKEAFENGDNDESSDQLEIADYLLQELAVEDENTALLNKQLEILKTRILENGFMHHKFCIIDNTMVLTGSYNWTYYAENRNIENIVVSTNATVVYEFEKEFSRLSSLTSRAATSPRLSWEEIERRDDVDYRELNNEIEYICEAQNLPMQKVLKPNTTVQIVDTKRTPRARFDIGIESVDNNRISFAPFIAKGQELPYDSKQLTFYIDSKNETSFPCSLIYGTPSIRDSWKLIKEESLLPVAQGIADENLEIRFSMHLDVNGNLRVDVVCPASRRTMMISSLNNEFVKYE